MLPDAVMEGRLVKRMPSLKIALPRIALSKIALVKIAFSKIAIPLLSKGPMSPHP